MKEPHISFSHALLKIEWAEQFIHHLQSEINVFMAAEPYSVRIERDPQDGSYSLEVGNTGYIPPIILLLAGDVVGNLRASLDFAWMGLVRAAWNGSDAPPKRRCQSRAIGRALMRLSIRLR